MSTPPLLNNTPVGTVFPVTPVITGPAVDARTSALRALAKYISQLTFYKAGDATTPVVPFSIPLANIHVGQPDYEEVEVLPSIVFHGIEDAQIDDMGFYDETSQDLYGHGTILWVHAEHIENLNIRILTKYKADFRGILAGLERALSPVEEIYGMSLVCSDYYNQTASICPISSTRQDAGAPNNRREATIRIDLRINIVQLVHYKNIVTYSRVNLTDPHG